MTSYATTLFFSLVTIITLRNSAQGLTCSECVHPKFQNHDLYLPFCLNGKTYSNLCQAICSTSEEGLNTNDEKPIKGSCDKCEMKCNKVFIPTCSIPSASEASIVFPNKCHAKCSGIEFEDCKNLLAPPVIPGKTKLPIPPISKDSPEGLQNLDTD